MIVEGDLFRDRQSDVEKGCTEGGGGSSGDVAAQQVFQLVLGERDLVLRVEIQPLSELPFPSAPMVLNDCVAEDHGNATVSQGLA